jgi:hypothetical protein
MRVGDRAVPATVAFTITPGTATAGQDYSGPTTGTLNFAAGVASQILTIPLTPDTVDEPNETFSVALSNATGGAGIGTPGVTVVTITDNDTAGKVQFSAANYSIAEDGASATITVTRSGGTSGQATVDYGTSDASASGTLTFGVGVTSQTFAVPITDNGTPGANVPVTLTLSNPGGGLVLGTQGTATLWIVDND